MSQPIPTKESAFERRIKEALGALTWQIAGLHAQLDEAHTLIKQLEAERDARAPAAQP